MTRARALVKLAGRQFKPCAESLKIKKEGESMARKWLKELRTSKGLTQQRMADMLGMSRQYYHLIESGNRKATLDIELAAEIAHIFRISLKKIYDNEKGVQA